MEILAKDSGAVPSIPIHVTRGLVNTTFRLIGSETAILAMTDIVIEQPDSEWDEDGDQGYSGDWEKKVYDGNDIVLNSDNREQTAYGTGRIRFNKSVDEQVGVAWDRE